MGAIQFIENLDRTSLTVSDGDFEKNVETAVSAIAERHQQTAFSLPRPRQPSHVQISEKSGLSQPEVVPRNSIEAENSTPRKSLSSGGRVEEAVGRDKAEEGTAVNGLLRTIQRPLAGLGRMFSEESGNMSQSSNQGLAVPQDSPMRLSPTIFQPPRRSDDMERPGDETNPSSQTNARHIRMFEAENAAAHQASAEAAHARRIQRAEHYNVVESVNFFST